MESHHARLLAMDKRSRRRLLIRALRNIVLAWIILLALYYSLPVTDVTTSANLVRIGGATAGFVLVIGWETRRILTSDQPLVRAIEGLGIAVPLFFALYSMLYLSMSRSSASNFSQTLNHTKALYFTVTVFATVGFGDITPTTDTARIVVMIQMILGVIFFGAIVRLFLNAAKFGLGRLDEDESESSSSS